MDNEDTTGSGWPKSRGYRSRASWPRNSYQKRYILVTGVTGAGKSTFISNAMGASAAAPLPKIGHKLRSETSKIGEFTLPEPVDGYEVVLVDTPGFDDSYVGFSETYNLMLEWLQEFYKAHKYLSGILFLHSIEEKRMRGSDGITLDIVKEICGKSFMPNLTLVSNMWARPESNIQIERESELMGGSMSEAEGFWSPLIADGAKTSRYHSHDQCSTESTSEAISIIENIVKNEHRRTQFEEEIFENQKKPGETAVSRSVVKNLVNAGLTAQQREKEAEKRATEAVSSTAKNRFLKAAEHERSQTENIFKELNTLGSLTVGICRFISWVMSPEQSVAAWFQNPVYHDMKE